MLDLIAGSDFLSAVIAFAIVLIPIIIIHEAGHFLAAKLVGITVLEFGIGFPPRMTRLFNWGETEFTLNWLPLGGFVRPLGDDLVKPISEDEVDRDREKLIAGADKAEDDLYDNPREVLRARGVTRIRAVNEISPLPRIFFFAAGALANFLTAILFFMIVALSGLPEDIAARMQLIHFPEDSFLAQTDAVIGPNDAIEQINGAFFDDPTQFFAMLAAGSGRPVSLTMFSLERGENYEVTVVPPPQEIIAGVRVLGIQPGSPAEGVFLPDDLIIRVNGSALDPAEPPVGVLQEAASIFAGREVQLTILRDGQETELVLVPREEVQPGEGRIGISIRPEYAASDGVIYTETVPQQAFVPQSPGAALNYGLQETGRTLGLFFELPRRLMQGSLTAEEARPASIIGVSQVGGQFLQQSIASDRPIAILGFVALISILVGITNLLPIPAFDGGRILFVLIEIVRGRPLPPEREGFIHLVGFVILLSLSLVIMLYDIFNPFILPG